MATHSSILAWRLPWTEEPGGLQSMGCKEPDTTERLTLSFCMQPEFPDSQAVPDIRTCAEPHSYPEPLPSVN